MNSLNSASLVRLDDKVDRVDSKVVRLELELSRVSMMVRVLMALAAANVFLSEPLRSVAKAAASAVF